MSFNKPGPNKRVCAFFIDSIIAQICAAVISIVLDRDVVYLVWSIIILFKDCLHGQSLGKYLVGTQIIDENDLPAKPGKTIVRNIFMIIPFLPVIEYIRMHYDRAEGKRIGDNLARTKVADLKPQIKDKVFLWISILLVIITILIQFSVGVFLSKIQGIWI